MINKKNKNKRSSEGGYTFKKRGRGLGSDTKEWEHDNKGVSSARPMRGGEVAWAAGSSC